MYRSCRQRPAATAPSSDCRVAGGAALAFSALSTPARACALPQRRRSTQRRRVSRPAGRARPARRLGVNLDVTELTSANLDARLAGLADAGYRWVRFTLPWGEIEPRQGQYDWSMPDAGAPLRPATRPCSRSWSSMGRPCGRAAPVMRGIPWPRRRACGFRRVCGAGRATLRRASHLLSGVGRAEHRPALGRWWTRRTIWACCARA